VEISAIVAGVIVLIAIGTAHVAGAAYVLAEKSGKSSRWAFVRTILSVTLALFAVRLAR
jgi:hypothetical protein